MKPDLLCRPQRWRWPLAASALVLLNACAMLAKESPQLALIDPAQVRLEQAPPPAASEWPQTQWWQQYGDAQLNSLMERALQQAPLMAVVDQRLVASRANTALQHASGGWSLNFGASLDRQDVSANGFLAPYAHSGEGMTGPWYTEGSVGVSAEYRVDLWGKERAAVVAALGVERARAAEAAQAQLQLTHRIALEYYAMQTEFARLALLQQAQSCATALQAAHQARVARGIEAAGPWQLAQVRDLELQKQVMETTAALRMARESLRALVGAGPADFPVLQVQVWPQRPAPVPSSLDYQLLTRRADLQAARWYVESALSQLEVRRAAFYPSFDIKAMLGLNALHLDDLLHSSSTQFNLVPGLSLPIFDSGRLNAALAGARGQSNVLIAQYNQAVIDAVRDVVTGQIALQNIDQQLSLEQAKLTAVSYQLHSAQAYYERGVGDELAVLEARLPVLAERSHLLELRQRQITAALNLIRALGGGYQAG
ncbi:MULTISPECIES: efflux transporter outer membrane subunit [unclassified Undibacterium]|uniref:efflux transporter outer membrane subunit n=1 Tax=unclassified Undibacterium TaxID=2630295 RepID=UPI002AC8D725|nr:MULTISPECIES: efflux transporter outer membrane subunit [unclassified Undibacterium]MEB0137731.1 efflux transporter outer membrane subunit [Undibacterium sp. CCC2.1]MEB0172827.1 efflux transporter outer membrane subunit [Undibacterium sp. CCC1.1]MEB0176699.1 efflux transporter outer membrane subunit [Undibacterium sp. CCC3.4]MEB0215975.1 efflux transporter outer membrane subunit [Undibacterium sp. 5I2]WPX42306.1 efflux transporter outer membrane subunit [Undibacterium sp. CCC3.4]